jgi:DNA polymerase III epsilon subunit-like protein
MLDKAETLPQQVDTLVELLKPGCMVACYGAGGDSQKFNNSVLKEGLPAFTEITWVCVLQLARKLLPGLASYNLGEVADYLDIARDQTKEHRAGEDARVLCAVWRALMDRLRLWPGGDKILTARALKKFSQRDDAHDSTAEKFKKHQHCRDTLSKVLLAELAKKTFSSTLTDAQFQQQVRKKGDGQPCLVTGRRNGTQYRLLAVAGEVCLFSNDILNTDMLTKLTTMTGRSARGQCRIEHCRRATTRRYQSNLSVWVAQAVEKQTRDVSWHKPGRYVAS